MRWGSILMGFVGVAVLDAVVSTKSASQNVGGTIAGLGSLVAKFISPAVPAFASAAKKTSTTTPAAATATAPTTGAPALSYGGST